MVMEAAVGKGIRIFKLMLENQCSPEKEKQGYFTAAL
jgi:hypothetical protein